MGFENTKALIRSIVFNAFRLSGCNIDVLCYKCLTCRIDFGFDWKKEQVYRIQSIAGGRVSDLFYYFDEFDSEHHIKYFTLEFPVANIYSSGRRNAI